jgi:hypothetical protein
MKGNKEDGLEDSLDNDPNDLTSDPTCIGIENLRDVVIDYHEFYKEVDDTELEFIDPWAASDAEEDIPAQSAPSCITPPGEHLVTQGESTMRIAELYGMTSTRILDEAGNKNLFDRRDPNVLYPGDLVYIPERRIRVEEGATEQRHRFRRKSEKVWLRLILQDANGGPRRGLNYTLWLEGATHPYEGLTDDDGLLERKIPVGTTRAFLQLRDLSIPDGQIEDLELFIQYLDPTDEISGARARLNNMGLLLGDVDNSPPGMFEAVIRAFQDENGLATSGVLDENTRNKLQEFYGV